MTASLRIAVFASGSGSNFQALAEAIRDTGINASIELVVCDKPSAYVLERAKHFNIETYTFRPKDYSSREDYEREIVAKLERERIDLIVLAGYMRIITDVLVEPYCGRMINIHPSLLPVFPGINGIGQALEYGVKITGVTVHFVDGGMDTGPIIAQHAVEVEENDSEETLAARIHRVEHELLPKVVGWIAEGQVSVTGRKVTITN
ncbi:phosphoribosylglycinamide formyltransferase [Cohnella kolymensis]|uniref:Phosphoribosylglycinamide formyltransferase n=1 Tax=Cohnella kolymensis TaxID=1590652 RepID=A0ABR5A9U3_9BACL|nr:phosphoribosylglycinamide formyltransferase [Cohnella kolymensis]KIL37390.1 phosphoribosylglycinamide formyltransferase [Cohnella kolymensis]